MVEVHVAADAAHLCDDDAVTGQQYQQAIRAHTSIFARTFFNEHRTLVSPSHKRGCPGKCAFSLRVKSKLLSRVPCREQASTQHNPRCTLIASLSLPLPLLPPTPLPNVEAFSQTDSRSI